MRQQCPLSTACSCRSDSKFPPHAWFPHECAPLMKRWNGICPAYNHCACTPAPRMLHAAAAPARRAHTHAAGDRATCLLTCAHARGDCICTCPLLTPANVATLKHFCNICLKQMKHLQTYIYNICVYQLQHPDKHTCNIRLKHANHFE